MTKQVEFQELELDKLQPAPYNPRIDLQEGDEEFEKLRRSIEEFGFVEPLIFNKQTGFIVGGHQRAKVLQALGYKTALCAIVDLTPEQEKALNIGLNKIGGDWDYFKAKRPTKRDRHPNRRNPYGVFIRRDRPTHAGLFRAN